jgi:hypothetical protein
MPDLHRQAARAETTTVGTRRSARGFHRSADENASRDVERPRLIPGPVLSASRGGVTGQPEQPRCGASMARRLTAEDAGHPDGDAREPAATQSLFFWQPA